MGLIGSAIIGGGLGGGGASVQSLFLETEPADLSWYYPCNDASGGMADATGHGYNLFSTSGTITFGVEGRAGDAINIGLTGIIQGGASDTDPENINSTANGWTIFYVCRPNAVTNVAGLFRMHNAAVDVRILHRMGTSGVTFTGILSGGENDNITGGPAGHFTVGTWVAGAIRQNAAGAVDLFTNGVRAAIGTHTNTGTGDFSEFEVGRSGASSNERSDMAIQHLAGWKRALTDQQIADLVAGVGL